MVFPVVHNFNYYKGDTHQFKIDVDKLDNTNFLTASMTYLYTIADKRGASGSKLSGVVASDSLSSKLVNKVLTDNVATLTTSSAHSFLIGDSVVVANVDTILNGTYTITSIPTPTTFTYAKTASNIPSTRIGDKTFSINNKAIVSEVATLTTTATHPYLVGETVVVTGVDSTFNGTHTITAVTSNTFSYAKPVAVNVTSIAVSPAGTSVVNQSASTAVATGLLICKINPTTGLSVGQYVYDVQITDPTKSPVEIYTVVTGTITVEEQVSGS
jgi:hypothetical protein